MGRALHEGVTRAILLIPLLASFADAMPAEASAEEMSYRVKPPDIAIPGGASLGEVRRTFQPFANWTLVCDENLKARTKICNVTQSFVDGAGATVFSWSLAATQAGNPAFILRAPSSIGPSGSILLKLSKGPSIKVRVNGCDAQICVATISLGPRLRDEIRRGEPVVIEYTAHEPIHLRAPLFGLEKAVAAID
ncbi:MAG: invasion associated locus B family protein [Mesorhizobium sp.]|nr:invasion associated locus B family protein [Mesorhizobium sp.]MBL8577738.1 invasion associated locus B family protein [Mesorhizobium sp.]